MWCHKCLYLSHLVQWLALWHHLTRVCVFMCRVCIFSPYHCGLSSWFLGFLHNSKHTDCNCCIAHCVCGNGGVWDLDTVNHDATTIIPNLWHEVCTLECIVLDFSRHNRTQVSRNVPLLTHLSVAEHPRIMQVNFVIHPSYVAKYAFLMLGLCWG